MKKIRIPLTWLLGIVIVMYFFVEQDIRRRTLPKRKGPLGIEVELEKGWDRELLKRARELPKKKKKQAKKEKKPVIPESTATITAFYTDTEPVLDGKLDETCWKIAQEASPFVEDKLNHLAHSQTRAYVTYSANNLYIGFICDEKSPDSIRHKITAHDRKVWTDDCVEVFIDTAGTQKDYFHFVLNTGGARYEARCFVENGSMKPDANWTPSWLAKTFIGSSFWSAEMLIPLRELGIRRIRAGKSWRINFDRERYAGERENSSWSCTYGGFHNPERFGTVIFQKKGLSLRLPPVRSKVGKNSLVVKFVEPPAKKLSVEVKLFSSEGRLVSTQETELKDVEGKMISVDYELKEAKMYGFLFTVLNPYTEEICYRTDRFPIGITDDDFIRDWLICGPFPNPGGIKSGADNSMYFTDSNGWTHGVRCMGWNIDFLKGIGGELSISPDEGMSLRHIRKKYKWRAFKSKQALIDFTKIFREYEYVIAYAACYVHSDEEKGYLVKLGSDDGYKLWVNHKLIASLHVHRGSKPDQNSHQVLFHKGWNLIMVKICQSYGGFNFYLRLTDLEGYSINLPVGLTP